MSMSIDTPEWFQDFQLALHRNFIYIIMGMVCVVMVLVVVLILMKTKPIMACNACMKSKPFLKGAYLNYASTAATKNGSLNPSDIAYSQNFELRSDIEALKVEYKRLVNAPVTAKVIFNSGASESIANCIFWAKMYNQFGSVVGTKYDHSAVKANCETFGLRYTSDMSEKALMDNCALVMLTQVNSKSGEILNIENFKLNFSKFSFLNDNMSPLSANNFHPFNDKYTLQYRPILALDASQSVGKVPIYMDKWGLNAVFFSLHKLGGPMGTGVLIINDAVQFPFKPLISGSQQMQLRGGTLPMQQFIECDWVLKNKDDANARRGRWNAVMTKLTDAGLTVYKPTNKHLYNTFLICVKGCPMKVISRLAGEGIYVGNVSACKNEELLNTSLSKGKGVGGSDGSGSQNGTGTGKGIMDNIDGLTGGQIEVSSENTGDKFDNSIRISFAEAEELTDDVVNKIIKAVKTNDESGPEPIESVQ